jgi:short-subunit dehydrogenase
MHNDRIGPGRTVVITGASAGIGAATAQAMAAEGADVVLVARRGERLAEVAAACTQSGARAHTIVADLADLDGVPAVAARIVELVGVPDVLVNNAGVPMRKKIAAIEPALLEGVMAMNYFSPARLTTALLPRMLERGSGDIVNVSSMGAHMVAFGVGAYAASKAALEMFTEALHVELAGTGVRAHILVPGSTISEFREHKPGNDDPMPADLSTFASAEDVAAGILRCVRSDALLTYAVERDEATARAKQADPNAFVAAMSERLAAFR